MARRSAFGTYERLRRGGAPLARRSASGAEERLWRGRVPSARKSAFGTYKRLWRAVSSTRYAKRDRCIKAQVSLCLQRTAYSLQRTAYSLQLTAQKHSAKREAFATALSCRRRRRRYKDRCGRWMCNEARRRRFPVVRCRSRPRHRF